MNALILVVLVVIAGRGTALRLEPTGTSRHVPPLLDCAPGAAGAGSAPSNSNLSAFRGNVLALLGALPAAAAAAAAAPTDFFVAATDSGGADDDRAFARAFCFAFGSGARRRRGSGSGSFPIDCLECLSAAAQDVAAGCHGRRRGAVWRAGCSLSYADTEAPTAREDAWRGWFYDGDGTPTAGEAELGACVATDNRTAEECSRCLNESARVVPALKEGRQLSLSRVHGDAVVVVGYSCYLRVPLLPPPATRWVSYAVGDGVFGVLAVVGLVAIEIGGSCFASA